MNLAQNMEAIISVGKFVLRAVSGPIRPTHRRSTNLPNVIKSLSVFNKPTYSCEFHVHFMCSSCKCEEAMIYEWRCGIVTETFHTTMEQRTEQTMEQTMGQTMGYTLTDISWILVCVIRFTARYLSVSCVEYFQWLFHTHLQAWDWVLPIKTEIYLSSGAAVSLLGGFGGMLPQEIFFNRYSLLQSGSIKIHMIDWCL